MDVLSFQPREYDVLQYKHDTSDDKSVRNFSFRSNLLYTYSPFPLSYRRQHRKANV